MFKKSKPKLVCKNCGYVGNNFFERSVIHYAGVGKFKETYYRCPQCGNGELIEYDKALKEIVSNYYKGDKNENN